MGSKLSAAPKIPYRETIRKKAEGQGKHKKQTGGHGQYGDVWLRLEPHPDYEFVWEITGGVIPTKYMEAVEMGIKEAAKTGPLAGYPVIGFRAVVYHGSYHEVDSSDMAFQLAARLAFRNVVTQASPTLLEPIYTLKIFVPQDRVGDILSDMQSRRGRILGLDQEGALAVVSAEAPWLSCSSTAAPYRGSPRAPALIARVLPLRRGTPQPGPEGDRRTTEG